MELDYINSFTKSVYSNLKSYLEIDSKKGQIEIKNQPAPFRGIAILIGIVGDVKGKIIFDMDQETGFRLVEKFNDEPSTEVNDMFVSTLKEFGNIICGNAMINLEQVKMNCDITTPTIILGEQSHVVEESSSEIMTIPFHTSIGQIDINFVVTS